MKLAQQISEKKERSNALIEVGYFLSRFTDSVNSRIPLPPVELCVPSWGGAYDLFYPKLHAGRKPEQFRNSLKNSRDEFDGYFQNGREGWKESDGTPQKLTQKAHEVFNRFESLGRADIWQRIQQYLRDPSDDQLG